MQRFTELWAIVMALIIINETISACGLIKIEDSYMRFFNVYVRGTKQSIADNKVVIMILQ